MTVIYDYLFPSMWFAYLIYWWVKPTNIKEAKRRESVPSRIVRLIFMLCAVALLWLQNIPLALLDERFIPPGVVCFWIGSALTFGGLLFSIWARRHLGTNWSQAVTIMEGHQLITTGPYSLVRHPIYSGLLLGLIGTALALGKWRGLLAVALVLSVLWHKLRLEEKWMRVQFGDSYDLYSRRVSALLPHVF